jgi:hypothetical protein
LKSSVVHDDVVPFLGKCGVIVLALVGCFARIKLLGTASEEDVRACPIGPLEV